MRAEPPPRTAARFELDGSLTSGTVFRLLEHGDGEDLRWLLGELGEAGIADHFSVFGSRLSRRSRIFWATLLDREAPAPPPLAAAIWPLCE